ncbi:MAG: radical SAM/SPASM domain-containing protein [Candidatus Bruticola sp.]
MKFITMAKAGAAVLKGRLTGSPRPIFATIATNNTCQSRCRYCKIPARKQPELTTEQIKTLIKQMADFGIQRLGIWGGEPLLRSDIEELVAYARHSGLYTTLDTNGYLVPQKASLLKELDHLIISLDGPEEAHDANREPGSFAKAMAAVETASASQVALWTITVLTSNNINKVEWILDQADKYNFTPTFQVLHHSEHFGVNNPLRPSDQEYKDCLRYLKEAKLRGRRIGNSIQCLDHLLNWQDFSQNTSVQGGIGWSKCWAGRFYLNIDADGRLYPCSLLIGDKPGPSALELGFAEAASQVSSQPLPCHSCSATCFTEYNLLFSLNHRTIMQWVMAMGSRLSQK